MILKVIQQIIQMFDKIQMIVMMETSISNNHITRLNDVLPYVTLNALSCKELILLLRPVL